jgi:hypothetical protein
MRPFVRKLQETNRGSMRLLSDRELFELKEFVKHRGFRIITESNSVKLENGKGEHIIQFPLTENDAVKIFKAIQPNTFSRKTPKNQRFTRKKK